MDTEETQNFRVMGIVNVTPDSFSDGGMHYSTDSAFGHAEMLINDGASILDIGGASSRPGSDTVPEETEIARVVPVIRKIAARYNIPISVDTTWVNVAKAAIDAGATIVNDISAGRFDSGMARFVADADCSVVLMHSRKMPKTMQQNIVYDDVIQNVKSELSDSVEMFLGKGVRKEKIFIDPGIGFAKSFTHNVAILNKIDEFLNMGYPLVLGTSRKSFIGTITGRDVSARLSGSLGSIAGAYYKGVRIFRVHDVKETVDFLKVVSVIESKLDAGTFSNDA